MHGEQKNACYSHSSNEEKMMICIDKLSGEWQPSILPYAVKSDMFQCAINPQ